MTSLAGVLEDDEDGDGREGGIDYVTGYTINSGPQIATYIALMHPDVGHAVAQWLDHEAYRLSIAAPGWKHEADPYALAVARALNGDAR